MDGQSGPTPQVQQMPGYETMRKLVDDASVRVNTGFEELGKAHAKAVEFTHGQIDEMAVLAKSQVKYVAELQADTLRMAMESTKRLMGFFVR